MTPRTVSIRVAHEKACPQHGTSLKGVGDLKDDGTLKAVRSRGGCTCNPSFFTFRRDEQGKVHKGPRVKDPLLAQKERDRLQTELSEGRLGIEKPEDPHFDAWADRYEQTLDGKIRRGERQPGTLVAYRETLHVARMAFGGKRLSKIGPPELQDFYERFESQSPASRLRHLRHLGACMSVAVDNKKLAANPVPAFRKSLGLKAPRQGKAPFEDAELARLWLALRHYELVMLAASRFSAETGLRIGEVVGLDWSDVDLTNGIMQLVTGTKGNRYREVVLTPQARRVLEQWVRIAGVHDTGPVFPHPLGDGRQTLPKWFLQDRLEKAMADASIPKLHPHARDRVTGKRLPRSFHSLRYTSANLMRRRGIPEPFVQETLGHSTIELTCMYATLTPDQLRALASSGRRRR
jgi:integrase